MEISKSALAAVVALGVAAGAYIGIRQGTVEPEPQASAPTDRVSSAVAPHTSEPPAGPIEATGTVVPAPGDAELKSEDALRRAGTQPAARSRPARSARPPADTAPADEAASTLTAVPIPDSWVERPAPPIEVGGSLPEISPVPSTTTQEAIAVPARSVMGLQLESTITSEQAQVEDEVVARVTRDVRVDDKVAIPAGARVQGFVTLVERGGRLKEQSRLGVRFTSLILGDGSRLAIDTETVYRDGDSATRRSAAKIGGGAIGGAIIGGILGGAKGAAIGSTVGAGAGTAAVMTGGRSAAVLNPNTPITVRLEQAVVVTVDRERR